MLKGSDKKTETTIASGPVLIENGKVLLSKDNKDPFWKFPGGTVLDTESFLETAIRELKEESNLTAELKDNPIIFTFHKESEDKVSYYILIHYPATNPSGNIKPNDPAVKEVRFFELENLPHELAPNVKPIIEQLSDIRYDLS